MIKLIEKVDNKVLKQAQTYKYDNLLDFVNELNQSSSNYEITTDQLNTLNNFYNESYISLDEPFLRIPELYGSDRKDNIKNFAYTVRILSIITNPKELDELYKSNKYSGKLDTSDIEDSWQLFALQVWKLLANPDNGKLQSNKKRYSEANISSEYRKLIENCIIIITNALQAGDGKSIKAEDIYDTDNIRGQINTLLKANGIKSSQISSINNEKSITTLKQYITQQLDPAKNNNYIPSTSRIREIVEKCDGYYKRFSKLTSEIDDLEIDDLIDYISNGENQEQPEQKKKQSRYMVYKSKSGGVKDINGQPVLLYDKDGNPITLAQTEVEHYVGNSV